MPIIVDIETVAIDAAADLAEPVSAPANWKDEAKIAAYVQEKQADQISKAALYPWTARIVALGIIEQNGDETVVLCRDEAEEREALRHLWASSLEHQQGLVTPIVTFNGLSFDLPVLLSRSRLLGVKTPVINLDKYRTPHVDLMQVLTFRGAIPARSLKWFAERFQIPVDDAISGKEIGALVAAGDWDGVRTHCLSDIRLTRALAQRLGYWQKAVAA